MTEDMVKPRKAPHVQAAFINSIREEGTKEEACDYLQEQWNECCALSAELAQARLDLATARADAFKAAAHKFEDLAVLRKMWSAREVVEIIRNVPREGQKQ